jgi:hypothetical protein
MAKATWEEEIYPDGHVETGHIKGTTRQGCDGIINQYAAMGNMTQDERLDPTGFKDEVHETHS